MLHKKILLLCFSSMLIVGCSNNPTKSLSYNNDIEKLVQGPYETYSAKEKITDKNYSISYEETKTTEDNFLYTVKFEYKNQNLNNFKAILLPGGNFDSYKTSNLPSVGYYSTMNLVPTRPNKEDKNNYPMFKLQIEKKEKQDSIYFIVSYNNSQDLFKITY